MLAIATLILREVLPISLEFFRFRKMYMVTAMTQARMLIEFEIITA